MCLHDIFSKTLIALERLWTIVYRLKAQRLGYMIVLAIESLCSYHWERGLYSELSRRVDVQTADYKPFYKCCSFGYFNSG